MSEGYVNEKRNLVQLSGNSVKVKAGVDKGEEIIEEILEVCKREDIKLAFFMGIGGCSRAELQTFIPEWASFPADEADDQRP